MKKGDTIHRRQEIGAGEQLMHGFESLEKAMEAQKTISTYYNLPEGARTMCDYDTLNPGQFAVISKEDTYVTCEAKVNWIVDNEAGITFKDSGGSNVINLDDEENQGWVVIKSAAPVYQSDVEHMSDDELRASIEALRSNRIAKPPVARKRAVRVKEPPMSKQDKQLSSVLNALDPEAKLALQRKLGLVE